LVGTNISGTAANLTAGTVTTNADMTGDVTSSGSNATTIAHAGTTGVTAGTNIVTALNLGTVTGTIPTARLGSNSTGGATNFLNATGAFSIPALTVVTVTGSGTIAPTTNLEFYNSTTAGESFTLPLASAAGSGHILYINTSLAVGGATINRQGTSDTIISMISGTAVTSLQTRYTTTLISTGSVWVEMAQTNANGTATQ
jgi:hypothetical protein